jgi:HD-GYP domain-containing protein (c-di-GMP phosphodiesterase class II)
MYQYGYERQIPRMQVASCRLASRNYRNSILDKPAKLKGWEREIVKKHPGLTRKILSRIRSFGELAEIAGDHHEKLDGSGSPNRKTADELPLEARIIAVADVYGALTEDRPYRQGLPVEQALEIMSHEIPHKLDAGCYEALIEALGSNRFETDAEALSEIDACEAAGSEV